MVLWHSLLTGHRQARSRCSVRSQQLVSQLGRLAGSRFRCRLPLRRLVGHRTFWKLSLLSGCWEVRRPPRRRLCWRLRVLLEVERPRLQHQNNHHRHLQCPAQAESM